MVIFLLVLFASLQTSIMCGATNRTKSLSKKTQLVVLNDDKIQELVKKELGILSDSRSTTSAAIALAGISSTLAQFAQAVGAETQREKQQAVLAALSSITGTAGMLMLQAEKGKEHKRDPKLATKFNSEISAFIKALDDAGYAYAGEKIRVISQLKRAADQRSFVEIFTSYPATAASLLHEIFNASIEFFKKEFAEKFHALNSKIRQSIIDFLLINQQKEITEMPEGEFVVVTVSDTQQLDDQVEIIADVSTNKSINELVEALTISMTE